MGNIELRKLLQHYLKTVRKYESKEEHPSRTVLRTAKKLIRRLSANLYSFPREVIWQDFLSIPQRQKLQQMFDALASWLSAEARALLRQHLPERLMANVSLVCCELVEIENFLAVVGDTRQVRRTHLYEGILIGFFLDGRPGLRLAGPYEDDHCNRQENLFHM